MASDGFYCFDCKRYLPLERKDAGHRALCLTCKSTSEERMARKRKTQSVRYRRTAEAYRSGKVYKFWSGQ